MIPPREAPVQGHNRGSTTNNNNNNNNGNSNSNTTTNNNTNNRIVIVIVMIPIIIIIYFLFSLLDSIWLQALRCPVGMRRAQQSFLCLQKP